MSGHSGRLSSWVGAVVIILLMALLWAATTVSADTYQFYSTIHVKNNSTADLINITVLVSMNNTQLANLGYIESSGLDTNVLEGATEQVYSMSDVYLPVFVGSLESYQTKVYQYRMTYSPPQITFPVATGYGGRVTTVDTATLEPGRSFQLDLDGFVDTSLSGVALRQLVGKTAALYTYVNSTNTIASAICNSTRTNYVQQTSVGTTYTYISASYAVAAGERLNATTPGYINNTGFFLLRAGAPTGTGSATVRYVANNTLLGTLGTIDVSTITAVVTGAWYNFTSSSVIIPSAVDVRILFEYTGGSTANYIMLAQSDTDLYAAGLRTNATAAQLAADTWSDAATDASFKLVRYNFTAIVMATNVSSGKHLVRTVANNTNLAIYIDSVPRNSISLTGIGGVPDNNRDWVFFGNNSMPYVTNSTLYVGGIRQFWYQPTAVISGSILPDRSGNSHTGTIYWGTNPSGLNITVDAAKEISDYTPPSGEAEMPNVLPPLDQCNLTQDEAAATVTNLPIYGLMHPLAASLGWSDQIAYGVFVLIFALAFGFAAMVAVGTIWGGVIGFGSALAAGGIGTGLIPTWVALVSVLFILFAAYVWRNT